MEKYFRKEDGTIVNLVDHILEQVNEHNNLTIRIGTDSQDYKLTKFVTVVVFRYGLRGAHYIFNYDEKKRYKTEYLRLYEEGVKTIETSELISREIPISIEGLEFDFADVKKTLSSKLVQDFKGWTKGINQVPIFKSGQMIATKAADHIIRKKALSVIPLEDYTELRLSELLRKVG
jgi:predicted RNase H-related nuclease YkuK (DUF458 family)